MSQQPGTRRTLPTIWMPRKKKNTYTLVASAPALSAARRPLRPPTYWRSEQRRSRWRLGHPRQDVPRPEQFGRGPLRSPPGDQLKSIKAYADIVQVEVNMRLFALVLAASLSSGCSWIMIDRAPKPEVWDKTEYSTCTTSSGAPILDTIGAVLWGISTLVANAAAIIIAAPLTASAYYGHTETDACKAYGRYRLDLADREREEAPAAKPAKVAPTADVVAKAKKCQEKGGIWVNDACQLELGD